MVKFICIIMAQQFTVGQGLLFIKDSRSHSDTPQSVGLLWTSEHFDAETSTWKHNTHKRQTSMLQLDSNPQSQQESGRTPTP